jgi:hypothetical protein
MIPTTIKLQYKEIEMTAEERKEMSTGIWKRMNKSGATRPKNKLKPEKDHEQYLRRY